MRRFRGITLLPAIMVLSGCWEFLEPEFAEQDATTIMQVDARLNERGDFLLNALLIPGLDDEGFLREVVRDTLYVFGLPVASSAVNPNGSRLYSLTTRLSPQEMAQPFTVDPPVVAGLAPGPRVRWSSPLPLDPDTVRIAPGADLELRTAYDSTVNSIRPVHQWFFELSAGSARFQVGANTTPPNRLVMPATFIPQPTDSVVRSLFTSFQTAQIFQNDYRGVYSYTFQFDNTIIVR